MNKANSHSTPKAPAAPQISGVSPELEALLKAYDLLPRGNWPAVREIRDQNGGSGSPIGKSVDQLYTAYTTGMSRASHAIFAFPARSQADLAAKLAFASRTEFILRIWEEIMPTLVADAMRLAKPGPSDATLLALARDAETAHEIWKVLWQRFKSTDKFTENEINPDSPSRRKFYAQANEAAKKTGHLARAVFGHKAHTLQGVLAKLRIVELAYGTGNDNGDAELEAYQRGSWLGSTIKDLDRLAGVS